MRNLFILGTMASAVLLGSTQLRASEAVHFATASAAVANTSANLQQDQWRYRYHNNQWWYWMPGNYWMTYNNGGWNRYNAAVGAAVGVGPLAARAYVAPRYNNGYYGYNNYGNRYGNYYRGNPYYNRGYNNYNRGYYGGGYRNYGPGGVAGRAVIRAIR